MAAFSWPKSGASRPLTSHSDDHGHTLGCIPERWSALALTMILTRLRAERTEFIIVTGRRAMTAGARCRKGLCGRSATFGFFEFCGERGDDLEEVADDAVVG